MDIITGYKGEAHITSAQDRAINAGICGNDSYILNVGNKLAADIISANEIQIEDGILMHQGCAADISAGTYDTLQISNGSQGMKRTDLIVARYEIDAGTNVESIDLVVIEGTASASNPVTPAYNSGSIRGGDSPVDMPLYKVNIDGVSIDSIDLVAPIEESIDDLKTIVAALSSATTDNVSGSNQYASASGTFVQIGRTVNAYFEVTATQAISSSTGAIPITDLPNPTIANLTSSSYDDNSPGTDVGSARLQKGDSVPNLVLYGARTSGHKYICSFSYIAQ